MWLGKKAVVYAGTGPFGQRGAVLLAQEVCKRMLTSRKLDRAKQLAADMAKRFGVSLTPMQVSDQPQPRLPRRGADCVSGGRGRHRAVAEAMCKTALPWKSWPTSTRSLRWE